MYLGSRQRSKLSQNLELELWAQRQETERALKESRLKTRHGTVSDPDGTITLSKNSMVSPY